MAKIVITNAGLDEMANAEQSGTERVKLTQAGFGTGQYTATADMTALKAEFKKVGTVAGGAVGGNVIHLTITDASTDAYTVYEFGLYSESGTLFALYSQNTPIIQKAAGASAILTVDIVLSAGNPEVIEVGDVTFTIPPATTTLQGVVELATDEETQAGTDAMRAVTPAALKALTATTERAGLVELATAQEAAQRTEASKALTPSVIAAAILNVVYPVGSIYMSMADVNPASFIGGAWKRLEEGRVLIGANSKYKAGATGGAETHTLSVNEMPAHGHSGSSGSAGSHTHTRGTMNITAGGLGVNDTTRQRAGGLWGSFYVNGTFSGKGNDTWGGENICFDASRSWSGETSSAGGHTHTVSVGNTGGGVAHNNMQPYLAVYMFQRTA